MSEKKKLLQKCGTPGYVDPDVLKGFPFNLNSDIFSLGCILYNLVTGRELFAGKTFNEILLSNTYVSP